MGEVSLNQERGGGESERRGDFDRRGETEDKTEGVATFTYG